MASTGSDTPDPFGATVAGAPGAPSAVDAPTRVIPLDPPSPQTDPPRTLRVARAPRPPRRRRIALLVVAVVLLLLAGGYVAAYLASGDRLPRGATIEGLPVGGLGREAAIATLTRQLGPRAAQPVAVSVAGHASTIDPTAAGLTIDYAASVDAAGGGRSWDPRQIVHVLLGGGASAAVVRVDDARLAAAMTALAKDADSVPSDAAIRYEKTKPKRSAARPGVALDQNQSAVVFRDGFLAASQPIVLPAQVTAPEVTTEEADAVLAGVAKPAVSGPIRITATGVGTFAVTPAMIAKALTFVPENGTLAAKLDAEALIGAAGSALAGVELNEPRDATVRLKNGKPVVVPAVDGTQIAAADLAAAVEPALTRTGKDRKGTVALSGAAAKFSTADARALGVREVTGQFTTYFPYLAYRNVNIGRAAELINNTLLKPGETFSLNGVVGERTKANGFVEGFVIRGGKFRKELGGGVSQSATTTFNAMFFAGLKDIQHQPHTLYIDRYPPGREATVAWPSLDLKFQNDTKYGVLVQAFIVKASPSARGSITVRMWSTKTYEKVVSTNAVKSNFTTGRDLTDDSPDCEPMTPVPGFDVNFARLFYKGGEVVRRENFRWRYAPTDRVRCE